MKFHEPDTKVVSLAPRAEERDRSEQTPFWLGRLRPGKVQATTEVNYFTCTVACTLDKTKVSSVEVLPTHTSVLKIQLFPPPLYLQDIEKAVFESFVRVLMKVRLEAALQIPKKWKRTRKSLSPATVEDEIFFGWQGRSNLPSVWESRVTIKQLVTRCFCQRIDWFTTLRPLPFCSEKNMQKHWINNAGTTLFSESFLQILNYTPQVPIKKNMKYNIYI